MKEAMINGIEYAFDFLSMNKLYLYVDVDNEKAVHIYQDLGFKIEGTMIDQFFSNEKYKDSHFMGLFRNNI